MKNFILTLLISIFIYSCGPFKEYAYKDEYITATPISYVKAINQEVYKVTLKTPQDETLYMLTDKLNMKKDKFYVRVRYNKRHKPIRIYEITD